MQLLTHESQIDTGLPGVELTNLRFRVKDEKECHSLFLRELSSVHIDHDEKTYYLNLAILLIGVSLMLAVGILGFMGGDLLYSSIPFFAGLFSLFLYGRSRRTNFVAISTGGGRVQFQIKQSQYAESLDLLEKVEHAKADAV